MNESDDGEGMLGEDAVEYINVLLELIASHQSFLTYKGIDRKEFEDFLNSDPYTTTIH